MISAPDPRPPVGMAPPGYRLPDATRLGRVRLQAADLARSFSFCAGVLGLRVLSRSAGRKEGIMCNPAARIQSVEMPASWNPDRDE